MKKTGFSASVQKTVLRRRKTVKISDDVIRKIIDTASINVEFQPIYSLNTKKFIGLEALARGVYEDKTVSPYFMFKYAALNGMSPKLDRICREKAMQAFAGETRSSTLFLTFF